MGRWMACGVALTVLAVPGFARASTFRQQSERDWPARGIERMEIWDPSGLVSIRAGGGDRIHLIALEIVRNATSKSANELFRATEVQANAAGGALEIRAVYPHQRQIRIGFWDLFRGIDVPDIEVRFALEVPPSLMSRVHTASGDVETAGLAADQAIETTSGDVTLEDAARVVLRTTSGDVKGGRVGALRLRTSSGDVELARVAGPADLATTSGDVRIDAADDSVVVDTQSGDVRIGRASRGFDIHTSSGDVVARGAGRLRVETSSGEAQVTALAPLALADIRTGSGDVTLGVAADVGGSFEAENGSGTLDLDLPLATRTITGQRTTGTFGHGTARLHVVTSSGTIHVASSGGTP